VPLGHGMYAAAANAATAQIQIFLMKKVFIMKNIYINSTVCWWELLCIAGVLCLQQLEVFYY